LWLISVATEWSYQEAMEHLLANQQITRQKSPLPASQFDPLLAQAPLTLSMTDEHKFVCHTAAAGTVPHRPILILANARTGSNLFFSFIKNLASSSSQVDVLQLYEVFGEDDALLVQVLCRIIDQIRKGCGWNTRKKYTLRQFATPEEVFQTARAEFNTTPSQQHVLRELEIVFKERFMHPAALLQFLHRVPSRSLQPFFVLKVFPYHLTDKLQLSVADFIDSLVDLETQHVILWRRNMLETFVSFQIAKQRKKWTNVGTREDDAVPITKSELDWFVQHTADFYVQARDYLTKHAIPYEEFEYDRDLRSTEQHSCVIERIHTQILNQTHDEALVRQVLEQPGTAKQALVPLSKQIVNWKDVESWGYKESTEEWPDLFSPSYVAATGTVITANKEVGPTLQDITPIGGKVEFQDEGFDYICQTTRKGAKPHQPILIIANTRTGSNLLFAFFKNLAFQQESAVDVLNLYEFFGDDMALLARVLCQILDRIQVGCGWETHKRYATRKFSSPATVLETALAELGSQSSRRQVIEELQRVIVNRLEHPVGVLDFIHRIPSHLPQAYFVLKVFPDQVDRLVKTTIDDFVSLFSHMETQYVILWRRNILESFVSFQIAKQMKKWTNIGTTQEDAVQVKRSELEQFIRKTSRYYWQARDYLVSNSIPFEEFEYNRDLSEEQQHFDVVRRIQSNLLHQPYDEQLLRAVLDGPRTTKQALVPLSMQVINWYDVESWGYSEFAEEWPDVLALPTEEPFGKTESVTMTDLVVAKKASHGTSDQLRPVSKVDFHNNDGVEFICQATRNDMTPHQPILIVANARTGSNLFFGFIKGLASKQDSAVDILDLYEFFGDDMSLIARVLSRIIDQIQKGCGWEMQNAYYERKFSTPDEVFKAAISEFGTNPSQRQVIDELQRAISQRLENPAAVLDFIHRIPSHLPQAYFVLKVFPDQVYRLMNTTIQKFTALFSNMKTQYVILWRRNMLEIFVSFQIAKQMNKWTNVGTTENDAIEVDRSVIEQFIQRTTQFYIQARDYFESNSMAYKEFEYDRDLSDSTRHFDVVQRIQTELLHQPYEEQLLRSVLNAPGLAKQAAVPLSRQIVNWEDVKSWGYSDVSDDWPDILALPAHKGLPDTENSAMTVSAATTSAAENTLFKATNAAAVNEIEPIGKTNFHDDSSDFICDTSLEGAKHHQPILIVANARTGSNLFFAFIKNLASKQEGSVNVLNLYEFFGDDVALVSRVLCRIIDQIQRGCGWNQQELYADRKFSSPEEVLATALSEFDKVPSHLQVIEELQKVISQRLENPAGVLEFIHRIPSHLPQAYFVLKVFPDQVNRLMNTTIEQFIALFSDMKTKYVILWRRNMLEIFVSFQIAKQMKKWTNVGTTEDDAIEVDRSELEGFIQKTALFYVRARNYFVSKSMVYEEFEYDRDLSDSTHHFDVVQRIQTSLLSQPYNENLLRSVLDPPGLAKQAVVPLSKQIVNWNDVESWGYSELSEEWPDILATSTSSHDESESRAPNVASKRQSQHELVLVKKSAENTVKKIRPIGKEDDKSTFICDPTRSDAKRHQPILMVANARTGSNLFLAFIKNLATKQESAVDVLNMYEFFGDDMSLIARVLCRIIDQIQRGCAWDTDHLLSERTFASPDEVFEIALSESGKSSAHRQVIEELQGLISQRLENPAAVLDFIHRIPSHLPQAYFVLKVFPDQITRLMKTTIQRFMSLFSDMETEYVVLWRRNMLEIFVSFQIAKARKRWTNVGTTEEDAIEIDRSELEEFIDKTTRYYKQARNYFALHSIPYEEFEYDRDLSDEQNHFDVVQRIQTNLLHQPYNKKLLRSVLNPPGLAKQAAVPLSMQIVNWDDVESWGYSEFSEEWPDMFA
jgi:LPS sulfotransferase NodH